MKSIISLLLNLQGKNSQCASFSAFDENEDALLPTVLPSTTTEKRNLFTLKEKFRKYLKRFYSHIFFSDAKRILFHSGGYTERRTKDSFSTQYLSAQQIVFITTAPSCHRDTRRFEKSDYKYALFRILS